MRWNFIDHQRANGIKIIESESISSAVMSASSPTSSSTIAVDASGNGTEHLRRSEDDIAEFQLIDKVVHQNYRYYYREYARLKGMG